MEDIQKSIESSGVKLSPGVVRMIERHVEKWIDREQSLLFLPRSAEYSVHIDRESEHYFTCQLEIRIGSREWVGFDEGRSVQDAVMKTLRHMKPRELWELYRPASLSAGGRAALLDRNGTAHSFST